MSAASSWIVVGLANILSWFGWVKVFDGATNVAVASAITSLVIVVGAARLLGRRHVLSIALATGVGSAIGWSGTTGENTGITTIVTFAILIVVSAVAFFVGSGVVSRYGDSDR